MLRTMVVGLIRQGIEDAEVDVALTIRVGERHGGQAAERERLNRERLRFTSRRARAYQEAYRAAWARLLLRRGFAKR